MFILNRIAELRKKAGLTQKELAEKLNINSVTLSRYETGSRKPSFETLRELSKIFNYASTSYIMGLTDEVTPIEKSFTEDNLLRTTNILYKLEHNQQQSLLSLLSSIEHLYMSGDMDSLDSLTKVIDLLSGSNGLYDPDVRINVFSGINEKTIDKKLKLTRELGTPFDSINNYFSLSESLKKEMDSHFLNKFNEHYKQ